MVRTAQRINTLPINHRSRLHGRFFILEEHMTQEQEAEHLDVHVAVCAERYKSLEQRLDRIERVMWWMLSTLILALGGMVFQMFILFSGRLS
jgi:hypothetical protein